LSALLKKLFENHVTGDVNEEFVKAAANGDSQKCEEVSCRPKKPIRDLCFNTEPLNFDTVAEKRGL